MSTKKLINQNINVAVDAVIFQVRDERLHVLLIQITEKPYQGQWAVPGGLIDDNETSTQAIERILKEQTNVSGVHLEQIKTFDDPKRDIKRRVVSIAYFALIPSDQIRLKTTKKYADVRWVPVAKLPPLAYDHKDIIKEAVAKLRRRLSYTNVVWSLLPREFTLTELQKVYESVLGEQLDKRNFRRKMLALGVIKPTGKKRHGEAYRPAELYRFTKRSLTFIKF